MNKSLTTISAALLLAFGILTTSIFLLAQTTYASDNQIATNYFGGKEIGSNELSIVESLTQRPGESKNDTDIKDELKVVGDLPELEIDTALTAIIKNILTFAMSLTMIALVVTGVYYLQSLGKEEDITKAKDIIIYLIIGMAIMAAAYGVVSGISQFNFFEAVQ